MTYRNAILCGDALTTLQQLPAGVAQTCVTSPPYYGLRDFGCDGQIGLEETPSEYVTRLVAVFAEVRRVLASDGTLWLNLGDSYANDGKWGGHTGGKHAYGLHGMPVGRNKRYTGFKPKDLMGIPWMVAFALRDAGWWLRSDIIWAKSNPMPESVRDRPTKAHEYLFLLSKSAHYFYNADAICEPVTGGSHARTAGRNSREHVDRDARHLRPLALPVEWDTSHGDGGHGAYHRQGRRPPGVTPKSAPAGSGVKANTSFHAFVNDPVQTRNKRSVWTVAAAPFPDAHFATFPPALIEPCVLAGSRPGDLVLDPFAGSGTVGLVARQQGREYLLVDLNADYCRMAEERIGRECPAVQERIQWQA